MDIVIVLLLMVILYVLVAPGSAGNVFRLPHLAGRRKIILDSCALIDGRIVELVRTGFIADELIIPKFILSELQLLADGNDSHKRERARFGLEIAAELQEYVWARVSISEQNFPGVVATDDKLVKLAKKLRGVLCTTDYNLNKVAAVEGIKTLNVNELSQSLRPVTLPGEELRVKIVQKGNNSEQGVGYLEDGTMIVVDGAARAIGSTIPVSVDRMHQTVAGKMVFAHAANTNSTQKLKHHSDKQPVKPRQNLVRHERKNPVSHVTDRLRKG
jgi:uncharacterized protein YacL